MKLVYAAAAFREERASWPPIIHFNVLRHVVRIVNLLEEALDEQEKSKPSISSEDLEERQDLFTRQHRLLCMKLRPLVEIEVSMTKHLLQSLQRREGEEVAVHSHFAWIKHFHRHSDHPNSSAVGDGLKSEMRRALNVSCDDILKLWHDPQVRHLLHSQEIQLEHEAGFFLEENDLKRITALNYEPSDRQSIHSVIFTFLPYASSRRLQGSTKNRRRDRNVSQGSNPSPPRGLGCLRCRRIKVPAGGLEAFL
jgi:guanine nucleotide-binding protein subunit alpha